MKTLCCIKVFGGMAVLAVLLGGCGDSVGPDTSTRPQVISAAPLEATVGQEYAYAVVAIGNPTPTFGLSEAPAGMTIDSTSGLITWVPASDSPFDSKVVIVAKSRVGSASQEYMLQVAGLQIEGWETSSLVGEAIQSAPIRNLSRNITAGVYPQIKSLLIVRNGKLVFESYYNGAVQNTALNIYSAEKSVTSCLMGIAIDQGNIASENELLYPFFPEYDSFANWSSRKEVMTLKHLLTMTSGFELEGSDYDLWVNNEGPRDWIKFYLDLPVVFNPGSNLYYKSLCDRLAGHVVEREAQTTLPQFASANLFEPLGMKYYNWSAWDPVNNSMISSRLRLRAIDMAKFGQVYLDGGIWQGNRIVSEDWVAGSTTICRSNYGYNWWIYTWETPVGRVEVHYAYGNGGNSIYVLESCQMVVVFTGDYFVQPDQWDRQYDIMKNQIIPAAVVE